MPMLVWHPSRFNTVLVATLGADPLHMFYRMARTRRTHQPGELRDPYMLRVEVEERAGSSEGAREWVPLLCTSHIPPQM